MPEVSISLFPDVGGSWFLNRMPGSCGRFLALTAASINATDALFCGIADRFIAAEHRAAVRDALADADWGSDPASNHAVVRRLLCSFVERGGDAPAAQVQAHLEAINGLCDGDDIHDVIDRIRAYAGDDPWLAKARDGLAHGSQLAALWIDRQLQVTRHLSLAEVFQAELVLATNIMRHPEFAEGVRALLIDKDRNPSWAYSASRDVPADVLDSFFAAPWPRNPLADLS